MGLIALLVLLGIEAGFFAWSIYCKSNHREEKAIIRIAELVILGVLLVTGVFEWGFRYYGLLLLLLVQTAFGIYILVKKNEKPYKLSKTIMLFVRNSLFLVFTVSVAIIFPQYEPPIITGEYDVATAKYTWIDEKRVETYTDTGENRLINVEFWYPEKANEKYPLVVFSHGAYGLRASNTSTYQELASNGYIVCSIDHPYHSFYTKSETGKIVMVSQEFMSQITNVNLGKYDDATQIQLMREVTMLRVEDMNFAIDTILERAKSADSDDVFKLIDENKIGVFGHSLGGAASIQLGRQRNDIGAVINLDGDMLCEYLGVEDGEVLINKDVYTTPLLNIWTDSMVDAMKNTDDHLYPHEYIADTAPSEYDVHITGANHLSITDLGLLSPTLINIMMGSVKADSGTDKDPVLIMNTTNEIILNFFNYYLKAGEPLHFEKEY